MGAMNKHPSCKITWIHTTRATMHISEGFASMLLANSHLEKALLDDMEGIVNDEALNDMMSKVETSLSSLKEARQLLIKAIHVGETEGTPYATGFASLIPHHLASTWSNSIVPGQKTAIAKIASTIKGDHLAPTRRFVEELEELEELTNQVFDSFCAVRECGLAGHLRESLERNEVSLQADFSPLMTKWMMFLQEYIIDSLVATHVAFESEGHPALMAS